MILFLLFPFFIVAAQRVEQAYLGEALKLLVDGTLRSLCHSPEAEHMQSVLALQLSILNKYYFPVVSILQSCIALCEVSSM